MKSVLSAETTPTVEQAGERVDELSYVMCYNVVFFAKAVNGS